MGLLAALLGCGFGAYRVWAIFGGPVGKAIVFSPARTLEWKLFCGAVTLCALRQMWLHARDRCDLLAPEDSTPNRALLLAAKGCVCICVVKEGVCWGHCGC